MNKISLLFLGLLSACSTSHGTQTASVHPSCVNAQQQLCEGGLFGQMINVPCSGIPSCLPPEQKAARGLDVLVTAGSVSQPYKILGQVTADTTGEIHLNTLAQDSLFRSRFAVAARGETPKLSQEGVYNRLRKQAHERYGKVDAIINATYHTEADGDSFGSGVAVQFIE